MTSSEITAKAKTMLLDISGMIRCPIHNGAVDFNGHKYQLSFNIRRDVYEVLVADTDRCLFVARPANPYDYLFGIPLHVIVESDAPMVALVIESMPDEEGYEK